MCILFAYSAKQGTPAMRLPFKLIIASNRDELLTRPAKEAGFWESQDNDILGGKDLQSDGTWFGINAATGKLGILLNIMGGARPELTTSRGSFITNFLRSPKHLTGWTYCKNLLQDPSLDIFHSFSQFNLVTIDLLEESAAEADGQQSQQSRLNAYADTAGDGSFLTPRVTYFTNHPSAISKTEPEHITTNFFSVGNSVLSKPFQKAIFGERLFEQIVKASDTISRNEFKMRLLQFLKSTHKYYPDPVMQEQGGGRPDELLQGGSSIFVQPSDFDNMYGTRTHTIALVDNDNNVDFHEWTLKQPVDVTAPEWTDSHLNFHIPRQTHQ